MIKKFGKFCGVLIALIMLMFTPTPALLSAGVAVMAADDFHHTLPNQSEQVFHSETLDSYEIWSWERNLSNYLISDQITNENIDEFKNSHPNALTMPNANIGTRQALVMTCENENIVAKGYIASPEITLPANGYYCISVWYYVLGESSYFYLDDHEIALSEHNGWQQSAFYIRTDRLVSATLTANLYLGSRTRDVTGAVYYSDFMVEAIRAQDYEKETAALAADERRLDLTNDTDVQVLKTYDELDFQIVTPAPNAHSLTATKTGEVPRLLKFADRTTFYAQNGITDTVMLVAAQESYASVKLSYESFTFKPLPHAVYMFQFYSIAGADTDKFFFKVGDTYHEVSTLTSQYHNGWQLNTFFYIGDAYTYQDKDENDHGYEIGFCLGYADNLATGWACIDDFNIYQVSGAYATDNASAVGVHDTFDLNQREEGTIENYGFDRGTASDITTATYPYPLQATGAWTTEGTLNGIVNTKYWNGMSADVANPGAIPDYKLDNNIYMMRNTSHTTNTLVSPELTTTAGQTTYISFNAIADAASQTRAVITVDDVVIATMPISEGTWHRYEFALTESEFASSRTYHLSFVMADIGVAFFDNVRTNTTPEGFSTTPKTTTAVDLANPVAIKGIWSAESTSFYANTDSNGIMLQNLGQVTTTIKNTFAYSLSTSTYYKLTVTAQGTNAFLALDGFDGDLAVTPADDEADAFTTYELYFYTGEEITTTNFMVTLGSKETDVFQDGVIYITDLTLTSVEDSDYEYAQKTQDTNTQIKVFTIATETEDEDTTTDDADWDFFGENWWYLVPTLITALAILLAVISFLLRKFKFEKHITAKTTSYARDIKRRRTKKKIVAEQSAKVDNVTDETQSN